MSGITIRRASSAMDVTRAGSLVWVGSSIQVGPQPVTITHGSQITAANIGLLGVGLTEADLTSYTGPLVITAPNTVITNKIITGDMEIRTTGVLIQKCMIYGNARIDADQSGCNFTIEDCTINAGRALGQDAYDGTGIGARDFIARRCNIFGGKKSVMIHMNGTLEYSFCHDQADDPTGVMHESGVRMGSDSIIRYNKIGCDANDYPPDAGCSACLTGYGDFATIERNLIEYNYFSKTKGGYGIYCGSSPSKPFPLANNIVVRNNIFQRNSASQNGLTTGFYGTVSDYDPAGAGNVWANNVYDVDGGAVSF